jgi:hypothetical protein
MRICRDRMPRSFRTTGIWFRPMPQSSCNRNVAIGSHYELAWFDAIEGYPFDRRIRTVLGTSSCNSTTGSPKYVIRSDLLFAEVLSDS